MFDDPCPRGTVAQAHPTFAASLACCNAAATRAHYATAPADQLAHVSAKFALENASARVSRSGSFRFFFAGVSQRGDFLFAHSTIVSTVMI